MRAVWGAALGVVDGVAPTVRLGVAEAEMVDVTVGEGVTVLEMVGLGVGDAAAGLYGAVITDCNAGKHTASENTGIGGKKHARRRKRTRLLPRDARGSPTRWAA